MDLKAIFHIDESAKWPLLLHNVKNLLQAANSAGLRVEVLANSEAVREYRQEPDASSLHASMRQLADKGVHFAACGNALKGLGIRSAELLPFVVVVPAGVLELVRRQSEGFAYIKP